jgi:hypothetical protein
MKSKNFAKDWRMEIIQSLERSQWSPLLLSSKSFSENSPSRLFPILFSSDLDLIKFKDDLTVSVFFFWFVSDTCVENPEKSKEIFDGLDPLRQNTLRFLINFLHFLAQDKFVEHSKMNKDNLAMVTNQEEKPSC